jgi:nitrogen-specific signal transduction histidine kinase
MTGSPPGADVARRRLAHEIRNAAGAIRTAAELLQRRYRPEGRDLRLFEVILAEVERLKELTKE